MAIDVTVRPGFSMPLRTDVPQMLFDRAFDAPREPRSGEYRAGVRAFLEFRDQRFGARDMVERDAVTLACPYQGGTVQSDAWWAGVAEGQVLWRQHTAAAVDDELPRRRRSSSRARRGNTAA